MRSKFSYTAFIEILKKGREKLVSDTIYGESPNLYDALYSKKGSEIFETKIKLYELEWIEFHWNLVLEKLNKRDFSDIEKQELLSDFADWLKDLFGANDSTTFDVLIIEEKIDILKTMILLNAEWELNIKKMKVSFEKSKRELNMRVENMGKGV